MRSRWQLTIAIVLSSVLAVAPAASQETLAVVNGEVIAKEALVRHLLDLSTVGRAQLEEMINEALLFQAAQSLGAIRAGGAVHALSLTARKGPLHGRAVEVRKAAVQALGKIGAPEAVPVLKEVLGRRSLLFRERAHEISELAAAALAQIESPEAQEALAEYAGHRRHGSRRAQERVAAASEPAAEGRGHHE